jgi:flavodoxin
MPKAVVVYHSRTGTTQALAQRIATFLGNHAIETRVLSIGECTEQALADVDYLLLGCWTQGWLFVRQHPDEFWVDFARKLPALAAPHVGLFATYKFATGSMFRKMRQHLGGKVGQVGLELKSRNGRLSRRHQSALERFIA